MRLAHFLALAALAFLAPTAFGQPSLLSQVEQGLQPPGATSPAAGAAQESGYLGFIPDETNVQARGVRVESVKAGAPAAQGGLRGGDLIVSVDGKAITGLPQLDDILNRTLPNQKIQITVERNGQPTVLNLTAGTRPSAPRDEAVPADATPGALPLSPPGPATPPQATPADTTPRSSGIVAQPQNPVPPASDTPAGPSGAAGGGGASLGVTLPQRSAKSADRSQRGALIADVRPGSPAAAAGLKPGQMIVRVDAKAIDSDDDLIAAIRARQPGQSVELMYREGNEVRTTTVRLAQAGAAAPPSSSGGFTGPGSGGGFSAAPPPAPATPQSGSPFRFGPGGGSRGLLDQIERGDNLARPSSTVYDPLAFAALQRRVEELEERLRSLENKLGGTSPATPASSGAGTTPGFGAAAPPLTPGFGPALGGTGTTP